ncbi:unnamed protein product [Ophioblennius macclurei]
MMFFLLFLSGIFACTGNLASASCGFKMSPPKVVVRYGDPLLVNCSSAGAIEGMGWESPDGGTGFESGASSVILEIASVKTWKLEPICFATFSGDGGQCTETLSVTIYQEPKSVSVPQVSKDEGPMVAGQTYQMKCDVIDVAPGNNVVVDWHKGGKIVKSDPLQEVSPTPVNKSSVFSLLVDRNDNEAEIWCEARLNLGLEGQNPPPMRSKSKQLTVLYPPVFDKPSNETVELLAGTTISLNCNATGNPMPVYMWEFPDSAGGTKVLQDVREPIFTPDIQIPGSYSCTASNSRGKSTKHFVVEASGDYTTFAAILGVFVTLGVFFLIAGLFIVTPDGTFSCAKNGYVRGQTTSGPV